jgi:hypothetical protein
MTLIKKTHRYYDEDKGLRVVESHGTEEIGTANQGRET